MKKKSAPSSAPEPKLFAFWMDAVIRIAMRRLAADRTILQPNAGREAGDDKA